MIGQSIGNSGLRKNEWIFEFEWLTKNVVLIYRDDLDHYKANANVYKGKDETGIKIIILKNEHQFGNADIRFESEKPHAEIKFEIEDKGRLDIFAGLKEFNLVYFSINTKCFRNHENVENVIATVELSPDGRVLKTEIDWRPEMFEEFYNSLIQARNNIVESRLLLGMISHKKSLRTMFCHKHKIYNFIKKLDIFHKKISTVALDFGINLEPNETESLVTFQEI